jgi:hypothetical protein
MTGRVYGAAGGTGRVLACVFGVIRDSLGIPGDEAIGADQQRAVRLEPMRGGRHHISTSPSSTPKRDTYIERYSKPLLCALRS